MRKKGILTSNIYINEMSDYFSGCANDEQSFFNLRTVLIIPLINTSLLLDQGYIENFLMHEGLNTESTNY